MTKSQQRILLVDDDEFQSSYYRAALQAKGFHVVEANSLSKAMELVEELQVDAVVLDVMMRSYSPFSDRDTHYGFSAGVAFARWLRQKSTRVPIVFLTSKKGDSNLIEWCRGQQGTAMLFYKDVGRCASFASKLAEFLSQDNPSQSLLVFIHGLGGDQKETWGKLPKLIETDDEICKRYRAVFYSFPTGLWRAPFFQRYPPIEILSAGLGTYIRQHSSGAPATLICHSLGGLIAKRFVCDELKRTSYISVVKLALFAVPNNGASLASLAKHISWRHRHLRQICRGSEFIDELNEDWESLGMEMNVNTMYVVGGQDRVVGRNSSGGPLNGLSTEVLPTRGHRDIVKPQDSEDEMYVALKRFLLG